MIRMKVYSLMFLCFGLWLGASAEQCGRQVGGALCPNGLCCSAFGWCGTTQAYCGNGCQSQCSGPTPPRPRPTPPLPPTPSGGDVGEIITEELFDEMLLHRNDQACPGHGFYTYDAFINASQSFSGFGTTGDETTRKRELAAFFGQTSHQTSGGWPFAEDGPYAWGYCFVNELNPYGSYWMPNRRYPCARGKKYYGRGPMQLSYNYNYGQAGDALGLDLLGDPDLISDDPVIAFETAMWYWMTPQGNIPSSHDVMTGAWVPRIPDIHGGRLPGYGLVTNIMNGGLECGHGYDYRVEDRIGFYKKYCDLLDIDYGDNLDCYYQKPFNWDVKSSYQM